MRVAVDLSHEGVAEIEAEKRKEEFEAEDLLRQFEVDMGMKTPETAGVQEQAKSLGQAQQDLTPQQREDALKDIEKEIGS